MLVMAGLKLPPFVGTPCMIWLEGRTHYHARKHGYFSEHLGKFKPKTHELVIDIQTLL